MFGSRNGKVLGHGRQREERIQQTIGGEEETEADAKTVKNFERERIGSY